MSRSPDVTSLALAGTGRMAGEYLKALAARGFPMNRVTLVSAAEERVAPLAMRFGAASAPQAVSADAAIIAVTPDRLARAALEHAQAGVRCLLIEKPAAMSSVELRELDRALSVLGARAYIAMNRRFYASVALARRLIDEDGGPVGCWFDFSDLEAHVHALQASRHWPEDAFRRWGLVNAAHVIDLAFHLVGAPVELSARQAGSLSWHPSGSVFAGSGRTDRGALFGYQSSYTGAGRWRIEAVTRKRRLVLCPLETLQQQGNEDFELVSLPVDAPPNGTKAGLSGMLDAFLGISSSTPSNTLPDLIQGALLLERIEAIFGYDPVNRGN